MTGSTRQRHLSTQPESLRLALLDPVIDGARGVAHHAREPLEAAQSVPCLVELLARVEPIHDRFDEPREAAQFEGGSIAGERRTRIAHHERGGLAHAPGRLAQQLELQVLQVRGSFGASGEGFDKRDLERRQRRLEALVHRGVHLLFQHGECGAARTLTEREERFTLQLRVGFRQPKCFICCAQAPQLVIEAE